MAGQDRKAHAMTTHGFSKEECELRNRLVAELQGGQKTLIQIQRELADYRDPDAAELRRFREREPLVQLALDEMISVADDRSWERLLSIGLRARNFKVQP